MESQQIASEKTYELKKLHDEQNDEIITKFNIFRIKYLSVLEQY